MKNIVLASLLGFGLISSAWATETVNIHERVNNARKRQRSTVLTLIYW
ncbi:silver-or copper-binding SilE domain protein [Escherichia coli 2729250]|nr:silver-or copper-binding SilE domain protein [Escherichia coli 2729250]